MERRVFHPIEGVERDVPRPKRRVAPRVVHELALGAVGAIRLTPTNRASREVATCACALMVGRSPLGGGDDAFLRRQPPLRRSCREPARTKLTVTHRRERRPKTYV